MSRTAIKDVAGTVSKERPDLPKGLLALTLLLSIAAPLAMYSGRVPGLGEFDYQIYYRLLFYNDFYNACAMLAALLIALAIPGLRTLMERLADWLTLNPVRGCLIAFLAFAVAARIVYQGFPLAMDEYAPLLQARIFAQGDIAITYPRELLDRMVVPGFQGMFLLVNHETGQAVSAYWPGLALLMTPFALFGGEWLLNPLLGAAGLWLIGDLARQASGSEQARGWAMLAALACPQYTVNALSYYAMTGLLTLNLLFLWLLLRPGWKLALLAGVAGSVALVMHNPVPHALFAAPVLIWLLLDGKRRSRLVPLAVGYLPLTLLLCLGWPLMMSAMGLRLSGVMATGAGFFASWVDKLQGIFFVPTMELLIVRSYAAWKALIWAAPGVLILALIAKRQTAIQRLLFAGFLVTFGFYFFFPYDQGHGWGYRYVHSAWGLVPITVGIVFLSLNRESKNLIVAALCAGLLAMPVFMYTTYRTITTSLSHQPVVPSEDRFLIFLKNYPNLYTVDLVRNYPSERDRVVRLISGGKENDKALALSFAPGSALVSEDSHGSVWGARRAPRTGAPPEAGNSR